MAAPSLPHTELTHSLTPRQLAPLTPCSVSELVIFADVWLMWVLFISVPFVVSESGAFAFLCQEKKNCYCLKSNNYKKKVF